MALERGQVGVDGGRRREPDRLADLPHRRRIALLPQVQGDEIQDFAALAAQGLGHGLSTPSSNSCSDRLPGRQQSGKHPFGST